MANPQKENGYTAIANELLEAIIGSGLSGCEYSVIFFILRKTYGYRKKQDSISISQFESQLPYSRRSIIKALKKLQLVNIIALVNKNALGTTNIYLINKDYQSWEVVNKTALVQKPALVNKVAPTSALLGKKLVNSSSHTKENTKENIQKKSNKQIHNACAHELASLLLELILNNNQNFKWTEAKLKDWAYHIDLMIRNDNRKPNEIEAVIRFAQQHEFWHTNILSGSKLRIQFDKLWMTARVEYQKYNTSVELD